MLKKNLVIASVFLSLCFAVTSWAQMGLDEALLVAVDMTAPDFDTVETLLNDGAFVNVATADGETVLMKAARQNADISVAELLLGWGANVNGRDDKGETALMKAAQYNANPRMVELIGRLGADVDALDNQAETALMKACAHTQSEEVITVILLLGADPKYKVKNRMAVDLAKKNPALKGTETLKILQEMSKK